MDSYTPRATTSTVRRGDARASRRATTKGARIATDARATTTTTTPSIENADRARWRRRDAR